MYIILTPRKVTSIFERFSPFTHTVHYRYRLINRFHPILAQFSRPELVAPHLESALDEQLWFARPISGAMSVSCFTSETSVPEIEHARHAPSFGHHTKALAGGGRNFEQPNVEDQYFEIQKLPITLREILLINFFIYKTIFSSLYFSKYLNT